MATADLYIRVSTDEQAIRGFSQRSQEDRLTAYCHYQGITILQVIFEDHTAKTFNRPAWTLHMRRWRTHRKKRPDHLLFTRWDRFSRNVSDSYFMINKLKQWGIEPQAIDQPLDLSIPENKLMLALYLATSEVENDRRALNIRQGMYKARQEGRWVGPAPLGYINRISPNGEKCIAPHEPEATLLRKVFKQAAESGFHISYIYKQALTWGLKCSRSNFHRLLRNPVYYGMIRVPEFEKKKAYLTRGRHEGIISEELFHQAQKVLRPRTYRKRSSSTLAGQYLPLRGYIYCPYCGRGLTGSGSRGRYRRYYYYHCLSPCRYRIRAEKLNLYFQEELSRLVPGEVYVTLFHTFLEELIRSIHREQHQLHSRITQSMEGLIGRGIKSRELLYNGDIDSEDYLLIKADCERRIVVLCQELQEFTIIQVKERAKVGKHAHVLQAIGKLYERLSLPIKRQLIALILSEKAVLEPGSFDRAINQAVATIFRRRQYQPHQEASPLVREKGAEDLYFTMIREAEQKEGREIPLEIFPDILIFLRKLSKLALVKEK